MNNLIDNSGSAAIHYGLQLGEWRLHPWVVGQIAITGNILNHGPDARVGLALFSTHGTPCEVFRDDNLAFDRAGNPVRLASRGNANRPARVGVSDRRAQGAASRSRQSTLRRDTLTF